MALEIDWSRLRGLKIAKTCALLPMPTAEPDSRPLHHYVAGFIFDILSKEKQMKGELWTV